MVSPYIHEHFLTIDISHVGVRAAAYGATSEVNTTRGDPAFAAAFFDLSLHPLFLDVILVHEILKLSQ
jgi:hypothetical protein